MWRLGFARSACLQHWCDLKEVRPVPHEERLEEFALFRKSNAVPNTNTQPVSGGFFDVVHGNNQHACLAASLHGQCELHQLWQPTQACSTSANA